MKLAHFRKVVGTGSDSVVFVKYEVLSCMMNAFSIFCTYPLYRYGQERRVFLDARQLCLSSTCVEVQSVAFSSSNFEQNRSRYICPLRHAPDPLLHRLRDRVDRVLERRGLAPAGAGNS